MDAMAGLGPAGRRIAFSVRSSGVCARPALNVDLRRPGLAVAWKHQAVPAAGVKRGDVVRAVIVRTRKEKRRKDGTYVWLERGVKTLGPSHPEDLVGRSVFEFLKEDDIPLIQARLETLDRGGLTAPIEGQQLPGKTYRWMKSARFR